MKPISIVIAIILVLVAVVFFMRDRGARQQLAAAEKQVVNFSNQVDRINVIMALHSNTNSEFAQQITNHLQRIAGLSNRFTKVSEDLKQVQQEHTTVRTELDKQTKRATDSDQLVDELENEVRTVRNMLQNRELEVGKLTATLKQAEADSAALRARLQKSEADVVRLQLDLNDEAVLHSQLDRLDRQWPPVGFSRPPRQSTVAEEKGAIALTGRLDTQAKGYYLQMQADGTVKLVPPLEAAGASAR
jgi:septal ring factor EnvC (AmiA/AmiB activator)